jgi:hypothetical protein
MGLLPPGLLHLLDVCEFPLQQVQLFRAHNRHGLSKPRVCNSFIINPQKIKIIADLGFAGQNSLQISTTYVQKGLGFKVCSIQEVEVGNNKVSGWRNAQSRFITVSLGWLVCCELGFAPSSLEDCMEFAQKFLIHIRLSPTDW